MTLNHQQEIAVNHTEGPILVLAGAGSGKTRVIVNRIHRLISECSIPSWQILAITFTNKAANEMRERLQAILGTDIQLNIGTFHSICARILRVEHQYLGYHSNFTITDEVDQLTRIKKGIQEAGINPEHLTGRQLISMISKAKNRFETPETMLKNAQGNPFYQAVALVYANYERNLKADQTLDFDDLLVKTVLLLKNEPSILEKYQNRFQYILIDEYQDTNPAQYEFVHLLGQRYRNVMAVGDDDQSIYGWRGAEISNILNFTRDFPGAKTIKLEQNYRSTQMILSAASAMMLHNSNRNPKNLWTERRGGDRISRTIWPSDRMEAEAIGCQIEKLIDKGSIKYGDIAIFYRINAQSRLLEEVLQSHRIPYRVIGNISFFKRKEVKDLLAYIRLILNPFDSGACRRIINVPKRGIGKTTVDMLEKLAIQQNCDLFTSIERSLNEKILNEHKLQNVKKFYDIVNELIQYERTHPAAEFIDKMIELTGYRSSYEMDESIEAKTSLEIVDEFLNTVAEFSSRGENRLADFADYLSLYGESDDDQKGLERDQVQLMTLHNAKGLEFPIVFITGLEENLCPLIRADDTSESGSLEEERRLMYVGMTRAKEKLFLYGANERFLYGRQLQQIPSRFLDEIPDEYIEVVRECSPKGSKTPVTELSTELDYKTGQRIRHPSWGSGTVIHSLGSGPKARLTIRFDRHGLKKIIAGLANLIRLN